MESGAAYLPPPLVRGHTRSLHLAADAPVFTRTIHAAYRQDSDRLELIEAALDSFDGLEIQRCRTCRVHSIPEDYDRGSAWLRG